MGTPKLQFLNVGEGSQARRLAVLSTQGKGPPIVWLGGFRSDMRATKAEALAQWAAREGRAFVRFDYSGHGESSGAFEEGTISRWTQDACAVIAAFVPEKPVLVGSSMGGWIALIAACERQLAGRGNCPARVHASALVLIAPAVDFTGRLMWANFPEEIRHEIETTGRWMRPSAYSPDPYPITKALIDDGWTNSLLGSRFSPRCPVHILQGMQDPDVPFEHALRLVEHLPGDPVVLTLIRDGDHRLSRPQDISLLTETVARAVGDAA